MAQEYDKYEYWRQFDDNSRWRGFIENEAKIEENQQNSEEDETISMLDYVLARCRGYSVSSDDENEENIDVKNLHIEGKKIVEELKNLPEVEENLQNVKNIPNDEIEKKLEETFYQLKQNC